MSKESCSNCDEITEKKQSYIRFKNIPKSKQDELLQIIRAERKIKSDRVDRQGRKIIFGER
jgi:hypothetical protein